MSEELFYHYSTLTGAKAIFLSGKLHPNLAVNGPAVHGDGVYLTTLDPKLGREQVGRNNWDGITRRQDQKMESYFEILLPSKKVKRAKERRNIQVHTGVLHLASYKWSLRAWNGDLLATQYFMVSSDGEAAMRHGYAMGRYTLCSNIATQENHPVYKQGGGFCYLYTPNIGDQTGVWGLLLGTILRLSCSLVTILPPHTRQYRGSTRLMTAAGKMRPCECVRCTDGYD
eukprot:GFUD01041817.1.p1 GENE.GFUD01041817.1~~GFUD01041817.1.p1  ORF type:complete len:228 (-),score=37.02 GFUD01041817.1:40-723(-)